MALVYLSIRQCGGGERTTRVEIVVGLKPARGGLIDIVLLSPMPTFDHPTHGMYQWAFWDSPTAEEPFKLINIDPWSSST